MGFMSGAGVVNGLANVQSFVWLALTVAAFALQLFAFIDSLRYSNEVYQAAGKQTKTFWVAILGVAALLGFIQLPPLGMRIMLLSLLGFVAAAVYLVDVRKALRSVDPRYRGR